MNWCNSNHQQHSNRVTEKTSWEFKNCLIALKRSGNTNWSWTHFTLIGPIKAVGRKMYANNNNNIDNNNNNNNIGDVIRKMLRWLYLTLRLSLSLALCVHINENVFGWMSIIWITFNLLVIINWIYRVTSHFRLAPISISSVCWIILFPFHFISLHFTSDNIAAREYIRRTKVHPPSKGERKKKKRNERAEKKTSERWVLYIKIEKHGIDLMFGWGDVICFHHCITF